MSEYFSLQQIEDVVMSLMGGYASPYEPLPEPLLEFDNFGKLLDNLVDRIIFDITQEPEEVLYQKRDLGKRFDAAKKEILQDLKKG